MGTKTLSITNEVYYKLKRRKLPGESFSDTIGRLVDRGAKRCPDSGDLHLQRHTDPGDSR